jgi:hypothetical protein
MPPKQPPARNGSARATKPNRSVRDAATGQFFSVSAERGRSTGMESRSSSEHGKDVPEKSKPNVAGYEQTLETGRAEIARHKRLFDLLKDA